MRAGKIWCLSSPHSVKFLLLLVLNLLVLEGLRSLLLHELLLNLLSRVERINRDDSLTSHRSLLNGSLHCSTLSNQLLADPKDLTDEDSGRNNRPDDERRENRPVALSQSRGVDGEVGERESRDPQEADSNLSEEGLPNRTPEDGKDSLTSLSHGSHDGLQRLTVLVSSTDRRGDNLSGERHWFLFSLVQPMM